MKIVNNITGTPLRNGRWEVCWREYHPGLPPSSRRRVVASEQEMSELVASIEPIVLKSQTEKSLVDKKAGVRTSVEAALIQYEAWLISGRRVPEHIRNVISAIRNRCREAQIHYCDQISYLSLSSMIKHYADCADHGRSFASAVKTFTRRMGRKFGVRVDHGVQTYGDDDEIPPTDAPTRVGCYTREQLDQLLAKILEPNCSHLLPKGTGRGRTSAASKERAKSTIYYRRRMAFLPLFIYLARYGARPIDAIRLRVTSWNPRERKVELSKKTNNKTQPVCLYVDDVTAQMFDVCVRGKSAEEFIFTPAVTRGEGLLNPRWTTHMVAKIFRRIRDSCEIKGGLYWLRHSTNTFLCKQFSGDLRLVADSAGYAQLTALQRYIHTPNDNLKVLAKHFNAVDQCSGLIEIIGSHLSPSDPFQSRIDPEGAAPMASLQGDGFQPLPPPVSRDSEDEAGASLPVP